MIARVSVDTGSPALTELYDYTVPDGMNACTGMRVEVPFGRTKRQGFVISTCTSSSVPASKLKNILRTCDEFPLLHDEDIQLAQYLSAAYHMPLSQAIRMFLPSGLKCAGDTIERTRCIELAVHGEEFQRAHDSLLKKDGTSKFPAQSAILNKLMESGGVLPVRECAPASVKCLIRKGFVQYQAETGASAPLDSAARLPEYTLTPDQKRALSSVISSPKRGVLLHGVTGSGKTELYVRLIQDSLEHGRGAILLVPEIALTPQMYTSLQARLGEPLAVFHSRLSDAERLDQWIKVRRGEMRVVLGARSAVFAPIDNLGIVIIDEEHETSYKSGRYPAYSAKEIALKRAEISGARVVFGSATPSIDTYRDALDGKLELVELPQRLFGVPLPKVEVIDMREEIKRGNDSIISRSLDDAIRTALHDRKQTIILLNRRGYASSLICTSCGAAVSCDQCDVPMTFHRAEGMLKCHYCGARSVVPQTCPTCGAAHLRRVGIGTQKLEECLHDLYQGARILRMDADTMKGRHAHQDAYDSFSSGSADILIGTQMIAKGFDFANVAVAAVIAADTMLHVPDFRSAERAFSQITQLAGRAGRRTDGKVYVQTYSPDHVAVKYASAHDYTGFFAEESEYRSKLSLPPYGQHIIIRFRSKNDSAARLAAKDFMARIAAALAPHKGDIIRVRASECAIRRIGGEHRYQILVHLQKPCPEIEGILFDLVNVCSYDHVLVGIDTNPTELF